MHLRTNRDWVSTVTYNVFERMIGFLVLFTWFFLIVLILNTPLGHLTTHLFRRLCRHWSGFVIPSAFIYFVVGMIYGLRRLVFNLVDLVGLRRLGGILVDLGAHAPILVYRLFVRQVAPLEAVVVEERDWWVVTMRPQPWDLDGQLRAFVENGDAMTGVSALENPMQTRSWRTWLNGAMRIVDGMDQHELNRAHDIRRWWRGQIDDERRFVEVPMVHNGVVQVPSAGSRYLWRVWIRMCGGLRRKVPQLSVMQRIQQFCPDEYDILVAKRYRKERYLESGCLSFIPYLERAVERAHREHMVFQVQQFACIVGEADDEMVPVVSQKSEWNSFLRRMFPAKNAVWMRRETSRLIRLVRTAKTVVGYTRMQLGTLVAGSALEMRSLRIALGQAVRTLEGRGDIRVRVADMPFVVDCCMFIIQPDGVVLNPTMY